MSALITEVEKLSIADELDIKPGDLLISINDNEIEDVLDYQFYSKEAQLSMVLERGKERYLLEIEKDTYDDLGLSFETYLMDKQKSCKNKCVFCFIDQLPKGLRKSLYFKDDDSRMSFLFGNYITLTNLRQKDVDRIVKMKISPINISVHTTNPELRIKMMKNPFAGESLKYINRFVEAGIKINAQLVVCPDLNDGVELEKTLDDLLALYPSIQSVAVVPVGLSRFREGLYPLEKFTLRRAAEVLKIALNKGEKALSKYGSRIIFPSDEFFLLSETSIPKYDFYEDFPQLENGVGMWSLLKTQYLEALSYCNKNTIISDRKISIATGAAAFPLINLLVDETRKNCHNLFVNIYQITNNFFGEQITVSGLVTGEDLIDQLLDKELGEELLISESMLRQENDLFLDDIHINDLGAKLNVKVTPVANDGQDLLKSILGVDDIY